MTSEHDKEEARSREILTGNEWSEAREIHLR